MKKTKKISIHLASLLAIASSYFLMSSCGGETKNENKSNVYFPVKAGMNWGYADTACNFIQNPVYEYAGEFHNDRALVVKNGKISYLNTSFKALDNFKYIKGTEFNEGKAFVLDSVKSIHCIDTNLKVLFTLKEIEEVNVFSDGMASFRRNSKYGFIDDKGKEIIAPSFDNVTSFSEGLCAVAINTVIGDSTFYTWTYIDKTGKKIIDSDFTEALQFFNGLAAVAQGEKWGWVDKTGKFVFGNDFEKVNNFSEGFASFRKNGQCGVMNKNGKIIVEPSYFNIGNFKGGTAALTLAPGSVGVIDTGGTIVIPANFKVISDFKDGFAFAVKNEKLCFINKKGKIFCNETYDSAPGFLGAEYLGDFSLFNKLEVTTLDSVSGNNL